MTDTTNPEGISDELRDGILINYFICAILGLIINSLLVVVLIKKIKRASCDIQLCTFVAFTDILVSFGMLSRSIFTKYPYNIFEVHPNWCKFDFAFTGQIILYSGYTLGILSLERFFLICFNIQMSIYFWLTLIAMTWLPQTIFACINVINDLQILSKTKISCTISNKGLGHSAYILVTTLFLLSFINVILGYSGIMIIKYKQCLNQINLNVPKEQVYRECRSTVTKAFIYIALYIFVFSGKIYTLGYEFITGNRRTIIMDVTGSCLIAYSAIVNALILLYMNQGVRESFVKLLRNIKSKIMRSES